MQRCHEMCARSPGFVTRPLSERFERSWIGRLVISIGVTVLLLALVGTHLPESALARSVREPSDRVMQMAASEQTWAVFAPNPRSVSLRLEAVVSFADGSTRRWTLPNGSAIGANLRFYRWRKWLESARADNQWVLWEPTARWIATQSDDGPAPPVKVELIRRFHENVVDGVQPAWQAFTYYTLDINEASG